MNDSEPVAPPTSNPINDDAILRQLLKELPGVKTPFQFKGWQKSFLDRFHYLLSEEGVENARVKYEEFQKLVLKLMKQILVLKSYYDKGEIKPERTSVKALSCIQELSKQIIAVTDEQVRMVPGTGQMEKEAGYTKFMMGAVLVKDNFKQHGRLVMCAESLARFHKNMSECINDRFILETMESFGSKLQLFCDIMSDLGLYQAMTKSQELIPVPEPHIEIAENPEQNEELLNVTISGTEVSTQTDLAEIEDDSEKSADEDALEIPMEGVVQEERQLSNTLNEDTTDEETCPGTAPFPGRLVGPDISSNSTGISRAEPGKLHIENHEIASKPKPIESPRRRLTNLKRYYPNAGLKKGAKNPYQVQMDDDSEDEPDYSESSSSETVMTIQTEDADHIFGKSQSKEISTQTDQPDKKDSEQSDLKNAKKETKLGTSLSNLKRYNPHSGQEKRLANPYQMKLDVDSEDEQEYSESSSSETVLTMQTEDAEHIFGKSQPEKPAATNQSSEQDSNKSSTPNANKAPRRRKSLSNFLALSPESKRREKSRRESAPAINTEYMDKANEASMEPSMPSQSGKTQLVKSDSTGSDPGELQKNYEKQDEQPAEDTVQVGASPKEQGGKQSRISKLFNRPVQKSTSKADKETNEEKHESKHIEKSPEHSGPEASSKPRVQRKTHSKASGTKSEESPKRELLALKSLASPSQTPKMKKDIPDTAGDSRAVVTKSPTKLPPPSPRSKRRDKKADVEKAKSSQTSQVGQEDGGEENEEKVLETVVVFTEDASPTSAGDLLNARVLKYILGFLSAREIILGKDVYKHSVHVVISKEEFGKADASAAFEAFTFVGGSSKKVASISALIEKADCYIVVSPDQSHSVPLMGRLAKQSYLAKCAGIVSYSTSPWCTMRGAVAISMMCHELGCLPVSTFCCFPNGDEILDEDGRLAGDNVSIQQQLSKMLIQLEWTAVAFKKQRASVGVPF